MGTPLSPPAPVHSYVSSIKISSSSSSHAEVDQFDVNSMDTKQASSSKNSKTETTFPLMIEDVLQSIVSGVDAKSFGRAACVCKTWNKACNRILARPKIASATSLRPVTSDALNEVVSKVLSEPIRPHFAIASVGGGFDLKEAFQLLVENLGSRTPIILTLARGIIGRDAVTDEFREVKFADDYDEHACANDGNSGVVLTVGFLPGLKVDVIPLVRTEKASQEATIDQFVMDIRNYTTSVSGCSSPIGIIMFGNEDIEQKRIIEKLDYAMSTETIIVGDERSQFLYRSQNELRNVCESPEYFSDAIALIFASDKDKLHGTGDIKFHLALSKGVSAIGPRHKAASVKANNSDRVTWLTARREGHEGIVGGLQILDDINNELENLVIQWPDLYIGVTKRRRCSIGLERTGLFTSLAFYGVVEGDDEYLYADGLGIRTGDNFQFYHPDPAAALAACQNISTKLQNLKQDVDKREVIGGFIFSCCGRGSSFFGSSNIDSSPFLENFPKVPLAGIFCGGEIGRGLSNLMAEQQSQEESSSHCCLHVYSTIYLVMSYTPAPPEH